MAPVILDFGTGCNGMVSIHVVAAVLTGRSLRYPLNWRLESPQIWFEQYGYADKSLLAGI